jgi:hypothetical protein
VVDLVIGVLSGRWMTLQTRGRARRVFADTSGEDRERWRRFGEGAPWHVAAALFEPQRDFA